MPEPKFDAMRTSLKKPKNLLINENIMMIAADFAAFLADPIQYSPYKPMVKFFSMNLVQSSYVNIGNNAYAYLIIPNFHSNLKPLMAYLPIFLHILFLIFRHVFEKGEYYIILYSNL